MTSSSTFSFSSESFLTGVDCAGILFSDIFVQGFFPTNSLLIFLPNIHSLFFFFLGAIDNLEFSSSAIIDSSDKVFFRSQNQLQIFIKFILISSKSNQGWGLYFRNVSTENFTNTQLETSNLVVDATSNGYGVMFYEMDIRTVFYLFIDFIFYFYLFIFFFQRMENVNFGISGSLTSQNPTVCKHIQTFSSLNFTSHLAFP